MDKGTLFGIVCLNDFLIEKDKYDLVFNHANNEIVKLTIFKNGKSYTIGRRINKYSRSVALDYFYRDSLVNFKFIKSHDGLLQESIVYENGILTFAELIEDQVSVAKYKDHQIVSTGFYLNVNETRVDTLIYFNPETYEEGVQVKRIAADPIKTGEWKYFDLDGKLLKVESY